MPREKTLQVLSLFALLFGFTAVMPGVLQATSYVEGCTPGFWKNHPDFWPNFDPFYYYPERPLSSLFLDITTVPGDKPVDLNVLNQYGLGGCTMMDALKFKGGSDLQAAAQIYLRHAVAALLNLAHPGVEYRGERWGFHSVNTLLKAINWELQLGLDEGWGRDYLLERAEFYDSLNNWYCPLGGNKNKD